MSASIKNMIVEREKRHNKEAQIMAQIAEEILQKIKLQEKGGITPEQQEKAKEVIRIFLTEFLPTPRPSGKEDAMKEKFKVWAEKQGFGYEEDTYGNAACVIPATLGFEQVPAIALQFHMDIVPAKESDSKTDPAIDGVKPVLIEDKAKKQWIRSADTTSLGADDGTGAAVIWQVAKDMKQSASPHGPLVVLATREEEIGLDGARNISFAKEGKVQSVLENAKYFMNADGEEEGKITIGCAGHEFLNITLPIEQEPTPRDLDFVTLRVSGLQGGHSGINAERMSANAVLAAWIENLKDENGWRIRDVKGGEFDNAIPTIAEMTIGMSKEKREAIMKKLEQHPEYSEETALHFSIDPVTVRPEQVMTEKSSRAVASVLTDIKKLHGVDGYFEAYGEKVPTRSLNFAIVDTEKPENQIKLMSRLGKTDEHGKYFDQLKVITKKMGANAAETSWMTPWTPDEKSQLPAIAGDLYQETFGKPLVVEVTRGGLELGPLHEKFPKSEKIAIATTITGAHSANEQVEVQSIADCYLFLSKLVGRLEELLVKHTA